MKSSNSAASKILFQLANQERLAELVTPEQVEAYLKQDNIQESFLPEIAHILGTSTFYDFIRWFGGRTIKLPSLTDILDTTGEDGV